MTTPVKTLRTAGSSDELQAGCFRSKVELDTGDEAGLRRAIALAKVGDMEGYTYLYERFADNIFSYVAKILRDEHAAEDVTQQVFVKLFGVIGRYETRAVPFSAWILRVARNAAVDHVRRDRLVPSDDVCEKDHDGATIGHDRRRTLTDALRQLPQDQRDVVLLRNLVGLTPNEIAGRMGRSETAVNGLHYRARRTLRDELQSSGAAPALAAA